MANKNPNKDGLIKNSDKTPKERKELAAKMGRASGEAKRRKKTMREALEMLMYRTELPEQTKKMLEAEGIRDTDDFNHQMVITRSLIAKAEAGDVQAYNAICAMIGEKPADKLDVTADVTGEIRVVFVDDGEEGDDLPSSEDEVDACR